MNRCAMLLSIKAMTERKLSSLSMPANAGEQRYCGWCKQVLKDGRYTPELVF